MNDRSFESLYAFGILLFAALVGFATLQILDTTGGVDPAISQVPFGEEILVRDQNGRHVHHQTAVSDTRLSPANSDTAAVSYDTPVQFLLITVEEEAAHIAFDETDADTTSIRVPTGSVVPVDNINISSVSVFNDSTGSGQLTVYIQAFRRES